MAVHYEVDRAIATVTLDAPENRNALSSALVGELSAHLRTAGDDPDVRAIVLTHTGTTFCAGADLKERRGFTAEECVLSTPLAPGITSYTPYLWVMANEAYY